MANGFDVKVAVSDADKNNFTEVIETKAPLNKTKRNKITFLKKRKINDIKVNVTKMYFTPIKDGSLSKEKLDKRRK